MRIKQFDWGGCYSCDEKMGQTYYDMDSYELCDICFERWADSIHNTAEVQ